MYHNQRFWRADRIMYSPKQSRVACVRKPLSVLLTRCIILFVFIGFDRTWALSDDELQATNMRTEKQSNGAAAGAIRWTLGPTAVGDTVHSIVFRERSIAKESAGTRPRKAAVPRAVVQGAPEAICIGEDGSQYVGGSFSGNRDFDTGPGFDFHKAVGTEDGFVTCFDRNGKYRWTETFGGKEQTRVRGITLSHGAVYAVCDESEGHVAILAIDSVTGTPKPGFGRSGCQIFQCGRKDSAAAICSHGDTIYVAIRCDNTRLPSGPAAWPRRFFTVVLAIDPSNGSAATRFGTIGVQTIGNSTGLTDSTSEMLAKTVVDPLALTLSGSSLFVVGCCEGSSVGIGGKGTITAGASPKAFIAALNSERGTAVSGFGEAGLIVMDGKLSEAADAGCFGRCALCDRLSARSRS